MYCDQCEQSVKGGCRVQGVCGKNPETSDLQDQLLREVKILAYYIEKGGKSDEELDLFIVESLFSTVTNVNFEDARLREQINAATKHLARVKFTLSKPVANPPDSLTDNPDIHSLKQLLTFGLKGMAAYLDHAYLLGKKDQEVFIFIRRALAAMLEEKGVDELIALNLECGKFNIRAMELLNLGHIERFGRPEPTKVSTGAKKGPAILVSGHDLLDLEEILMQTADKGISVYTHGEMLPAHGYPGLK